MEPTTSPTAPDRIAVLIIAYRGRDYLQPCIDSIKAAHVPTSSLTIFVVENGCPDHCCEGLDSLYPDVKFIHSSDNLGFAGGNNFGWESIQATGVAYDFLMLLNQDTRVAVDAIELLTRYLQSHPLAGAVQSLLMLDPETELINTAGNQSHFLGFGLLSHYREQYKAENIHSGEIGYASGAAVMVPCDLLRQVGLFEADMFMYLEDADLSWKLRSIGRPPHLCATSLVFHQYTFNEDFQYLRYLEQNRCWLILTYYKWQTLILISPAILMMEFGQLYFAIRQSRLREKLQAYRFLGSVHGRRTIAAHRSITQQRRTVSDHELTKLMIGEFRSPHLKGILITKIASPAFGVLWAGMRRLICW